MWPRPHLEALEDRFAPALLQVVGSGGDGAHTFDTFTQAYQASSIAGDIIQIEPSAGDVGPVILSDANKAHTVQGDPNFAITSTSEAASGVALNADRMNIIHLWVNGVTTIRTSNNYLYGDHLEGFADPGDSISNSNNTFSHDVITADSIIGSIRGILPTVNTGDQVLYCDFKSGVQLQFNRAFSELLANTTFEPSPRQGVLVQVSGLSVLNCKFSLTTTTVAIGADNSSAPTLRRDELHSQGGFGISVGAGPVVEGTAFQGNQTAVSAGTFGGDVDAGGGGLSIGGNEFTVNMNTAVDARSVANPQIPIFVNFNLIGPGVTAVIPPAGDPNVSPLQSLTQPQAFVQGLYHSDLTHTATLNELNGWASGIPSVGTAGIANAIAHSNEGLTRLVDDLYQQLLGRAADLSGQTGFLDYLKSGGTEEKVIESMLGSSEFAVRANGLVGTPGASTDLNFVRSLYDVLLGRTTESASEDNNWLSVLAAFGKEAVVASFLQSVEFRNDYVLSLYTSYTSLPADSFFGAVPVLLMRLNAPDQSEINSWANSNLNMQQIAVQISASPEFFTNR